MLREGVSSQHHDANIILVKLANSLRSRYFDGICNTKEAGWFAIYYDKHHSLSIGSQSLCSLDQPIRIDVEVFEHFPVAESDRRAIHAPLHSSSGRRLEFLGRGELHSFGRGPSDDRCG